MATQWRNDIILQMDTYGISSSAKHYRVINGKAHRTRSNIQKHSLLCAVDSQQINENLNH